MNHEWKYTVTGEDTCSVNIHDCIITEWKYGEDYTALVFGGGFCVSDGNKFNKTERHLLTGKSALILRGGKLIDAVIPEFEISVNGKLETQPAVTLDPADCRGQSVDVRNWHFDGEASEFQISGQLLREVKRANCPQIELRFACTEAVYCWDGYTGDAWYEIPHRFEAIKDTFYRLGFEKHEVMLNKIIEHNFGSWTGKFDRFYTLKHPDSDIIYYIDREDDNSGFVIKTAPGHAAAADNAFTPGVHFGDSINACELAKQVEWWLRREHFVAPGILTGVWNAVSDEAEIERLQIYFMHFHDAFIVGLDYTTGFSHVRCERAETGWPYGYIVNMRVQSSAIKGAPVIELRFEDVKRCSFTGAFTEFFECYLKFVDGLDGYNNRYIVWAGDPGFDPYNVSGELIGSQTSNFVAASRLKWRLTSEGK